MYICTYKLLDSSLDGDNPDHIKWVYEKSQQRANEYGIQGVTYRLTQGQASATKLIFFHFLPI